MHLSDILTPEATLTQVEGVSKKRVLELVSDFCSHIDKDINPLEAFECLVAREKLGSTGIGHGVAIPHGRLNSIKTAVGVFIQLKTPIEFGAPDKKPVDLIFGIFVPQKATDEYLELLSLLAKIFSNATLREKMQKAPDAETLYNLITGS